MNSPQNPEAARELTLKYLLDDLPHDEMIALDLKHSMDEEAASEFEQSVVDLIDAYVGCRLEATQMAAMDRLASEPGVRERVRFAKAIAAARFAGESFAPEAFASSLVPIAVPNPSLPAAPAFAEAVRGVTALSALRLRLRTVLALAAVLLFVVGLGIFRARQNAAPPSLIASGAVPAAYTVILSPGALRGDVQPDRSRIAIPSTARNVRFQVLLPLGVTPGSLNASLKSTANPAAMTFAGLPVLHLEADAYFELAIPAAELPSGDYSLTVAGPDGPTLAAYTFTLVAA